MYRLRMRFFFGRVFFWVFPSRIEEGGGLGNRGRFYLVFLYRLLFVRIRSVVGNLGKRLDDG